jgi:hypothetical protein
VAVHPRLCAEDGCEVEVTGRRIRCPEHAIAHRRRQKKAQKKRARHRAAGELSRACMDCGVPVDGRYHKCQACREGERECIEPGCTQITGPGLARCDDHASEKEKFSAYMRSWQKDNRLKVQLWDRRRWAREHGVAFEITVEDVEAIWPEVCPVCGAELTRSRETQPTNGSIDRIDNDHGLGYITGNVHVVCVGCNGRKSDMSMAGLLAGHAGKDWQRWAERRLAAQERRPRRRVVRRKSVA